MNPVNGDSTTWTIDRLARLAAAALADASPTQPNGRIREVPDVRTIRWYTSIGLLDRPAAMRGRTALYGRSHLAQLVAIKRLQADGLTVAAVQERLLGADESAVEEIALLPTDLSGLVAQIEATDAPPATTATAAPAPAPAPSARPAPTTRRRFWVNPAAPPLDNEVFATPEPQEPSEPTTHEEPAPPNGSNRPNGSNEPNEPTRPTRTLGHPAPTAEAAPTILGIRLTRDVTLLLPPGREPDAAARAAIAEAAQPLLDLLNQLGLSDN